MAALMVSFSQMLTARSANVGRTARLYRRRGLASAD